MRNFSLVLAMRIHDAFDEVLLYESAQTLYQCNYFSIVVINEHILYMRINMLIYTAKLES